MKTNIVLTQDCLEGLRAISNNTIDLIYLDPPFNTRKVRTSGDYSFVDKFDESSVSQEDKDNIEAFFPKIVKLLEAATLIGGVKTTYYLIWIAVRLIEMHRVLKDTGSLYLHCDSTMSHYLKLMLDCVFGEKNFRNEIIWKRTYAHSNSNCLGRNKDTIFYYTKGERCTFNKQFAPYEQKYIDDSFRHEDARGIYSTVVLTGPGTNPNDSEWKGYHPQESGRGWSVPKRVVFGLVGKEEAKKMSTVEKLDLLYKNDYIYFSKNGRPQYKSYLKDLPGVPLQEIWTDVNPISPVAKERVGYPTQKPLALLDRIIKASSNEGDIVLDPFCGSGTTCVAAKKLKRNYIGMDISKDAVKVAISRLKG